MIILVSRKVAAAFLVPVSTSKRFYLATFSTSNYYIISYIGFSRGYHLSLPAIDHSRTCFLYSNLKNFKSVPITNWILKLLRILAHNLNRCLLSWISDRTKNSLFFISVFEFVKYGPQVVFRFVMNLCLLPLFSNSFWHPFCSPLSHPIFYTNWFQPSFHNW